MDTGAEHTDQGRWEDAHQNDVATVETNEKLIGSLGRGLSISLIAILVAVATILGVVVLSAQSVDHYAEAKSREQVKRLLGIELDNLTALSLEYGWWNEAVDLLIYQRDSDWATENVSGYLQSRYGIEWVVSLNREANLVHGMHGDEEIARLPEGLMTADLENLMAEAVDTDFTDPQPAAALMSFMDRPALVAVAPYVAYEPSPYPADRAHGYLILVKNIDEALMAAWSDNFQIEDLALRPLAAASAPRQTGDLLSIPLEGPKGQPLGALQWRPENPGQRLLKSYLPWVLGGGLLIFMGSVIFYLRLRAYSRLAYSNLVELSTNRELLFRQANYDFLTGLANRSMFLEHVNHEMARCIRHELRAAILYIDLDGFKVVNDTLGHPVGDELLCRLANSMAELVRTEDEVARFGGDEFCLLLTNIASPEDASRVADKLHALLANPIEIGGRQMLIGASVGIVMIPDDTRDLSNVFRYADIAMYQAKSIGENEVCFYDVAMEERSQHHAKLKGLLANALTREELYLRYQPIYSLENREITGVEALLRWRSKELGEISPDEFIPVAEETGMIDTIGLWVVERTLIDLKRIHREAGGHIPASVNISAKQLRDLTFPHKLDQLLDKHGIDHASLKLEITESLLIMESDNEHSVLLALAKRGYQLVLDDFGTGYSALGYLNRYPLEEIKIDKTFVSGPEGVTLNASLVKTIVFMATHCGMKTVAEGIETPDQEAFVRDTGCTNGQGFLFSPPTSVAEIIDLMNSP